MNCPKYGKLFIADDDDDKLFLWYGYQRKAISLISSRDHCQISSPAGFSDMPPLGFELDLKNLISGLVE